MLTIDAAIDLWLGDLARRGRATRTRASYRRYLDFFAARFPRQWDVAKVRSEDCAAFLDGYQRLAKGTQATIYAPLNGLFAWLYLTRRIKANPMEFVQPITRPRPEDLDVVTVSTDDVRRLLRAGHTWTERLAVAIPVYVGPRRHATALLRRRDFNRETQELRFYEKGAKVAWKPIPRQLAGLLELAIADGAIPESASYLIPPEGPLVKPGDRDDRVVWRVVKRVADRAGVHTHVHALRAAFAVFYLEEGLGDLHSLKELMGHESIETTEVYLRKLDKAKSMEPVRELSWGVVKDGNLAEFETAQIAGITFESSAGVGAGGFEPPLQATRGAERAISQPGPADLADGACTVHAREAGDLTEALKQAASATAAGEERRVRT